MCKYSKLIVYNIVNWKVGDYMWRYDANGLFSSLVAVLFIMVLLLGVYLTVVFFWKMISYGRGQSQYKELFMGILFIALGVFLNIMFIW